MLDKFVAGLVTTYLGKYFENVNREQVKVSLWSGNVKLRHLRFRKDALRAVETSVCVKEGSIDELTVVIPWTRLQSECVVVLVKDMRILLQQKTAAGYDSEKEREEAYERKQQQLEIFEALIQQEEASGAGEKYPTTQVEILSETDPIDETRKDATFAARFKASILNNLKLEVQNVRVEYEGCHRVSAKIDRFETHACDAAYEPHFSAARERVLYKKVLLEGFSISVDGRELPGDDVSPRPEHVLRCAHAVARVQYQPVPYRADLPALCIDFDIDAVRIAMERFQFAALRTTWRELRNGESFDALRQFRPPHSAGRPLDDPRAWWRYATQATLYRVRLLRRRCAFSWGAYIRLKTSRDEYAELFKRAHSVSTGAAWSAPLTADEAARLRELEMDLPLDSVQLARRLAYSRARLEHAQCAVVVARHRSAARADPPAGWFAWAAGAPRGRRGSGADEEDEALRAELDAARRLVTAEQWTDAQRVAIAREFGFAAEDVPDLSDAAPRRHAGAKWRVRFSVGEVEVALHGVRQQAEGAFAVLALNRVESEASCEASHRIDAKLRVATFDVQSHLKGQRDGLRVLRTALERMGKKEGGELEAAVQMSLCRRPTQAMDAEHSDSHFDYTNMETVPNELKLQFSPIDCNLNVPFIRACLAFFISNAYTDLDFLHDHEEAQQRLNRTLSAPKNSSFVQNDPRNVGASLAIVVEREFYSDWQVIVTDMHIEVAEDDTHTSRLTIPYLSVHNDPAHKLSKRRRIFDQQQQKHKRKEKELDVTPSTFGDHHDDWVNYVYCTIGVGAAVDCRHGGDDAKWFRLFALPQVTVNLRKSIFARHRPLDLPLLGVKIDAKDPVCCNVTRRSLSVLRTSFSHVADLCQVFTQNASKNNTLTKDQNWNHYEDISTVKPSFFLAQLILVDDQFSVEHDEKGGKSTQDLFYAKCAELPLNTESLRSVQVTSGLLTIYHTSQPMHASHNIQLISNHVHIKVRHGDSREVEILVESGGAPHDVRHGVTKARLLLSDAVGVAQLDNLPLLEELVEQLCVAKPECEGLALRDAFATVRAASHTKPCSRVVLRCRTEEEAQKLILDIEACGVESHALVDTPVEFNNSDNEKDGTTEDDEKIIREEAKNDVEEPCVVLVDASFPQFTVRMTEERSDNKTPAYELVVNTLCFTYAQQERETVFRILSSRLSLKALGDAVLEQRRLLVDTVPCAANGNLATFFFTFRLRLRPHPHVSCKLTDMSVKNSTLHLSLSSELVAAVEMLWDIVGILTSQAFTSLQIPCFPWVPQCDSHKTEQEWRSDPARGALLRHNVQVFIGSIVLALYYPSDDFERAGEPIDDAVVMIEGNTASISWRNTECQSATQCVLRQPRMMMGGEEVISPAWGNDYEKCSEKEVETQEASCCPYIRVHYTIDREPSTLSLADFVQNANLCGFRYTHFLALSGGHLSLVYWHSQLWDLLEILSRGVVSRLATLVRRCPYIAGGPLLQWPQPDAPLAPFSWCLMHRHVQFTHVILKLPHASCTSSADGKNAQLWARTDNLSFHDELLCESDDVREGGVRAVRSMSQIMLMGMNLWGLNQQQLSSGAEPFKEGAMLLDNTNIRLDFVWELFRHDMWKGTVRPRLFTIAFPSEAVFHGTTHHFALLLDWMYGNFIEDPWEGYFTPRNISVNPFHLAAAELSVVESTSWKIDVPYLCVRLSDPVQKRCCIDPNGPDASTTVYVTTNAMDVAVVVERLSVQLEWLPDGSFASAYDVGELSAWYLSRRAGRNPQFRRHPSEAAESAFRFLRIHGDRQESEGSGESETLAFRAKYAVSMKDGEKAVLSNVTCAAVDLSLIPLCVYHLRDTLFSLRVMNAFGRIVRWEPRLPGVIPPVPSPQTQDFTTDHHLTLHMLNLSIPKLKLSRRRRDCCHVSPLFVASFKETVMRSTSAKFGANRAWSITVDGIVRNGMFISDETSDGGWALRPVIVPQLGKQRGKHTLRSDEDDTCACDSKKLFEMKQAVSTGLTGSIAPLWFLLPHTRDLYAVREALMRGGYRQLQWLPAFMEERAASRAGVLSYPESPSLIDQRVCFTIHAPSIVMTEHAVLSVDTPDVGNGVVFNLGRATITRDNAGGELRVAITDACVKSLQSGAPYVASPMGVCLTGRRQPDGTWDVRIRVDAIAINVDMSLYELILRTVAWRLEKSAEDAASVDSETVDQIESGDFGGEVGVFGTLSSSLARNSFALWDSSDAADGKRKYKKQQTFGLRLAAEWESFTLRVSRDNTSVVVSVGQMSALYISNSSPKGIAEDEAYSKVEGLKGSTLKYILATAAFFIVGVDNRQHFLSLLPINNSGCNKVSGDDLASDPRILVSLHVTEQEENINVRLGRVVVFLETETVLMALTTLFEPYRRIVLPEYGLHEVKRIESDVILGDRLVLSNRKKVHVCATGLYNYITLDGDGNEIHFIDGGSPLLLLDEGITLRIVNARIHLHGKALEYYMVAGNGSYVVVDPTLNLVFPGGSAGFDHVNSSDAEGESEMIPVSHLQMGNVFGISKDMEPGMQNSIRDTQNLKIESGNSKGSTTPTDAPTENTSKKEDPAVLRRIDGEVVLLVTIPGEASTNTTTDLQNQPIRSLVLQAEMSARVESTLANDLVKEKGTFALSEFGVRCEYLDRSGAVVGESTLVSEWALTVCTYREAERQRVEVICPRGVEIRLRYGDVSFCWRTMQQAQQALGHIETNVMMDEIQGISNSHAALPRVAGKEQQQRENHGDEGQGQNVQSHQPRSGKRTTSFLFNLHYINLDLIDDSTNVEIPLFRCRVEDIATPVAIMDGTALKLHLSSTWSVTYYDFISSLWRPLLEPVFLDMVLRREPNISLEDVMQRKGSLRVGIHARSIRLHFSTMLGDTVRRVLLLKKRLKDTLARDPPAGNTALKIEFFTYKIIQHIGKTMQVSFPQNVEQQNPLPPMILPVHEALQLNFPRTDGKELPASQHALLVSVRHEAELVKVSKVGRHLVCLGPGLMSSHVLVDISISGGQKLVCFRTNVAFYNELPFPVDIHGVRAIYPGENFTVPIDRMRHRATFTPLTDDVCESCAIGLSYDMLPHLYGQTLIGLCKLKETTSIDGIVGNIQSQEPEKLGYGFNAIGSSFRRAIFFFMRFAPRTYVGDSTLLDCKVTFEPPLFIINGTSLPMQVGLFQHHVKVKRRSFFDTHSLDYYEPITSLRIDSGERRSILEVNPLLDIYMDVLLFQSNNEAIGHLGNKKPQKNPVLMHSANKKARERTIRLKDKHGATLILHLDYSKAREVTILCSYCFVNMTPHCIQLADMRKGSLLAGLCGDESIPPMSAGSSTFLLNSERMEKLGEKAVLSLRVGRYSSTGLLQWTKWSDQLLIGALNECGIVNCVDTKHLSISLSYTVEFVGGPMKDTRCITLRPRWIIVNRTDQSLAFRQCYVNVRGETRHDASSKPKVLAPEDANILNKSRNESSVENAIQVEIVKHKTNQCCYEWSLPLVIDKLGDRTFNVRYETVIPGSSKSGGQKEFHADETILTVNNKQSLLRAASDVLMVSCYRRSSTMYVVISQPERPPYVVENRTRHTVYVRQRDVFRSILVYPRTTRSFVWEDRKFPPVMELWAADATLRTRAPVVINFDPQAVLKCGKQLRQEMRLPSGEVLFVRVRGLGSTSYAISVTTENTIDEFCTLPYFQCFFQIKVDSIYALLSDTSGDFALLSVKPLSLSFSQCAEADGGGDDEQKFEASLQIAQLDNERPNAKERVVAQLLDSRPVVVRLVRKLLRTTPVIYFKDAMVNLTSLEVHLEDSFIFHAIRFWEQLRAALGYGSGSQGKTDAASSASHHHTAQSPWLHEVRSFQCIQEPVNTLDVWKSRDVFLSHLLIEQVMVSISLYRSPWTRNDPIWERIGYLSLFIRSVKDARFVWRRVDQRSVYETLWLLGTLYASYYKYQLFQQMSNVLHVAGLDMMRSFVTDLLQGYFSSSTITIIDRNKARLGRRAEAHFVEDEQPHATEMQESISTDFQSANSWLHSRDAPLMFPEDILLSSSSSEPYFHRDSIISNRSALGGKNIDSNNRRFSGSSRVLGNNSRTSIIDLASRLQWSVFLTRVSEGDMREYGVYAVEHFLRTLNFGDSIKMQAQLNDAAPLSTERCERCAEMEQMRILRFNSDSLSAFPHPSSGIVTWAEFLHHVSWSEFVQMCSSSEVRLHGGKLLRSLAGEASNVLRVEGNTQWLLDDERE